MLRNEGQRPAELIAGVGNPDPACCREVVEAGQQPLAVVGHCCLLRNTQQVFF